MEHVDCAVIGAGVVGLAVARALARAGREVIILEAATAIGTETSSRNSEVIHAGIYYPPGSLKARLCREGKERLYPFCESRGVSHRRLGKLIVATEPEQLPALERLQANAVANQVTDVLWLDTEDIQRLEPCVCGVGGLFSPSTGIVDSHGLMLALLAEAQAAGATLVLRHPVAGGAVDEGGTVLRMGGEDPTELFCREVINCGGLHAPDLARHIRGLPGEFVPEGRLCKGNYFTLPRRAPFRHLVYPAPEQAGLGIHLTLDLGGMARFGPDVEWVESVDYRVDPNRAEAFEGAIRKYWPDLPAGALQPGYAGVRPKIVGPGQPAADFLISGPAQHGVPGQVHLFGIESPGLTACLAIADEVLGRLDGAP